MKFGVLITIFVSTYICISYSNPNLRKGELMESIITKQTQGKYDEAINLFIEIGKLAQNHTVDLSQKEQKLFFDCYHYRRAQLLNAVVDSENYLNRDVAQKMLFLFNATERVVEDLQSFEEFIIYEKFYKKVRADRLHFEAFYTANIVGVHEYQVRKSYENYHEVIESIGSLLGYADITTLDAVLGCSVAKTEHDAMKQVYRDNEACNTAKHGLALGRNASSAANPDLVPLTTFIDTYCKPDPPNILEKYSFKLRD